MGFVQVFGKPKTRILRALNHESTDTGLEAPAESSESRRSSQYDEETHGSNTLKRSDTLWSLSSAQFVSAASEDDKRKQRRKLAWRIPMFTLLAVGICVAVAVPTAITLSRRRAENTSSKTLDQCIPCMEDTQAQKGDGCCSCGLDPRWKNTVFDCQTWLDTVDLNTTFTPELVGGLPIMGLFDTWDDSSRASQEVPPLSDSWNYGERPIRGVNLGGWLVLEPFITPSLFGDDIVDEFTLCEDLYHRGGPSLVKRVIESHYSSFVSEKDFELMAKAGIDHVRIPVAYWAIAPLEGEPYLPLVSWRYLLRGIEWARKYGLRVSLDLHAVQGSQNGWNHSGRSGVALWLNSTDVYGKKYGDMSLETHKRLAKFFSQARYRNIVTFYGLVNEPLTRSLGPSTVLDWHRRAYDVVRECGFENYIVFGDGLMGPDYYNDRSIFNATRFPKMVLDIHQYMVFDPYLLGLPHGAKQAFVCNEWAGLLEKTDMPFIVGEWSIADTDCAIYLNSVGSGTRWEGNFNGTDESKPVLEPLRAGGFCQCAPVLANTTNGYPQPYREFLAEFALDQMSTFEQHGSLGWLYWNWKTESSPQWSFRTLDEETILNIRPSSNVSRELQQHICPITNWNLLNLPESI